MTETRNVAILLFDDAEILDFCGPYEVFSVASEQGLAGSFNVFTVAQSDAITARNGLSVNVDYSLESCPAVDILLVPGGVGSRKQMENAAFVQWIAEHSRHCELVLSVCTGALLLGKAGLLDGLHVTTHHQVFDGLRQVVPTATVVEDQRFVDNGKIMTSAGIAAGIDMSLHVVNKLLGRKVAEATAQYMEYPWSDPA